MRQHSTPSLVVMAGADVPWTLAREAFTLERVSRAEARHRGRRRSCRRRTRRHTIGAVLDTVQIHDHLVDELIVVDDHSSDDTATVADHHGARVVHVDGPVAARARR